MFSFFRKKKTEDQGTPTQAELTKDGGPWWKFGRGQAPGDQTGAVAETAEPAVSAPADEAAVDASQAAVQAPPADAPRPAPSVSPTAPVAEPPSARLPAPPPAVEPALPRVSPRPTPEAAPGVAVQRADAPAEPSTPLPTAPVEFADVVAPLTPASPAPGHAPPVVDGAPAEMATPSEAPPAPVAEAPIPLPMAPAAQPAVAPATPAAAVPAPKPAAPRPAVPATARPAGPLPTQRGKVRELSARPTFGARAADEAAALDASRSGWMSRLRKGLSRTGAGLAAAFTQAEVDESLYEELETALLVSDAGVQATQAVLDDLRKRVREAHATRPDQVKELLVDVIADLLWSLEGSVEVGRYVPTVMMVVGVNGAGKTTSIGKLTWHLAANDCRVLLAAADTFRAAAREQLGVWADRNKVEIVSQEGGDPAAVTYDAVVAGRARQCDVVIADTAGRLPTQLHLMEELKKIKRVITKAERTAPHEVLLVVDGNTGQNALQQVKAFDEALGLTGLIVTKLDGTAKGGVLLAIALWAREKMRERHDMRSTPVYFVGVGETLEDLQTFSAREFARAMIG